GRAGEGGGGRRRDPAGVATRLRGGGVEPGLHADVLAAGPRARRHDRGAGPALPAAPGPAVTALAVLAALLVVGLLAGAAAQAIAEATDRRRCPALGRLVRVGDTVLHVVVEGSGPVVLMDSGLGGSSIE